MALSLSACAVSAANSATQVKTRKHANQQPKKILLAIAISTALAPLAMPLTVQAQTVQTQQTSQAQNQHKFNITAGTLEQALTAFGQQAGIILIFSSELTRGINSQALQGNFSLDQGFAALLKNTSFVINKTKAGYVLAEKGAVNQGNIGTLATAIVQGDSIKNGSAEDGYLVEEITAVGPWQGRTLQQTPYSISVTSASLIQNLQATNADQVFSMNPLTQLNEPSMQAGMVEVFMRGFEQSSQARNGVKPQGYTSSQGLVMEEVAQIEILTGLSGFIYGASGVGGVINFVTKKPTDERLNTITLGNTSGSNMYLHGDFGGQFDDEGTFGYRINLVTQDGETHIKQQNIKRNSVSVSFDWQITDNLVLEINGNKRDHQVLGTQPEWFMADSVTRPDANNINNSILWSQPWIEDIWNGERLAANLNWQLNDDIALRAAYLDEEVVKKGVYSYGNTIQADGAIDQGIWSELKGGRVTKSTAGYIFADFRFDTGSINHKITAGWQFGDSFWHQTPDAYAWSQDEYFTSYLSKPVYFPEPEWDAHGGPKVKRYTHDNQSFTLGDDIQFNQQWSALIGINYTNITFIDDLGNDYGTDFDQNFVTPTLSLVYKPTNAITTYASYIEGVDGGGTADKTQQGMPVVNAGAVLEPIVSTQIELGLKANIGEVLLTGALFNIDRGLEQYQLLDNGQYKFTQDGRQVHKGLEVTATGKLTDNLSLVGGFTLLDAQIKDNATNPEWQGNTPINVAENMVKLYAEYIIDSLPGLVVNGGFSYNGSFYAGKYFGDNSNSEKLPSYTLVNIGARYDLTFVDKAVTLRFNVNNLTDERYWANWRFLGSSRTVSLSASVAF